MKYARFQVNKVKKYGIIRDNLLFELKDSYFLTSEKSGRKYNINSVRLLPPTIPSKIVALGYNYKDLVGDRDQYDEPVIFLKPPSAVIGHDDIIEITSLTSKVWTEVELCIVIGKTARNVNEEKANNYIFGYTIGNDVTTSNILKRDHHLARSKGWNTFCPIGPWIETELITDNLKLTNTINDKVFQESSTNMRIYNDKKIVSHLSTIMTLYPGDVIMTGTPKNAESSVINDNDLVTLEIEGIGILSNKVKLKQR